MGRVSGRLIMVFAAAAGGLLGACSHSGGGSGAPLIKRHAAGTSAAGNSPADGADSGPTDLVSAVSGGGADEGPVGLKFQLGRRPVSGEPVVITLRLIANQALEHLEARFLSDEGLTLTQGAVFDPEGHMDAGSTIDHSLTLVPDHDGVYTVMATVTAGAAAEGLSRSFVIPIVVGGAALPVSAPAAKPVVARKPK